MFKCALNDCHYISNEDITEIVDAWREIIVGYMVPGWDSVTWSPSYFMKSQDHETVKRSRCVRR